MSNDYSERPRGSIIVAIQIRPFADGDATALAEIFFASVRDIASRDHTPDQIAAWTPKVPDPNSFRERAVDGRTLLVAANADDEPIAYGDIERDGHIDHLYCSPEAAGRGVAKQLYKQLELAARNSGATMVFVEASETAKGFFQKQGFELIRRNDFQLNGVAIHNYAMRKDLF